MNHLRSSFMTLGVTLSWERLGAGSERLDYRSISQLSLMKDILKFPINCGLIFLCNTISCAWLSQQY